MRLRNCNLPCMRAFATSSPVGPNPPPRGRQRRRRRPARVAARRRRDRGSPGRIRRLRRSSARGLERRHPRAAAWKPRRRRSTLREGHAPTADRDPHCRGRSVGGRHRWPVRRWAHGCLRRHDRAPLPRISERPCRGPGRRVRIRRGRRFARRQGRRRVTGGPRQPAPDGLGAPDLGQPLYGNGSAANPFSTLGRHVNKIMASRAVVSWGHPTTRLWQVMCGGGPASMEKAAI